ncbi:MAG: hypothetical protein L6R28_11285 [Planctomycetes bacterium]|nr:hypothetical protein [Planctomycetota bacterium]
MLGMRWLARYGSVPVLFTAVAWFAWVLNNRHMTEGTFHYWGWPFAIWGSGIPGTFGDPLQIGVAVLNACLGLALATAVSIGWALLLRAIFHRIDRTK